MLTDYMKARILQQGLSVSDLERQISHFQRREAFAREELQALVKDGVRRGDVRILARVRVLDNEVLGCIGLTAIAQDAVEFLQVAEAEAKSIADEAFRRAFT